MIKLVRLPGNSKHHVWKTKFFGCSKLTFSLFWKYILKIYFLFLFVIKHRLRNRKEKIIWKILKMNIYIANAYVRGCTLYSLPVVTSPLNCSQRTFKHFRISFVLFDFENKQTQGAFLQKRPVSEGVFKNCSLKQPFFAQIFLNQLQRSNTCSNCFYSYFCQQIIQETSK